jgi:hypothetical protein
MIEITLVFSVMFAVMSLLLGTTIGWIYRGHIFSQHSISLHPEMFDSNGNIVPDEIIAFRFENGFEEEEEEFED